MRAAARRHAGFTLVEMLVTTVIMGLISIYLLDSMVSQQRSYSAVDQISEIQQNSRLVGELLERDIRHAGFMVPEPVSLCGIDATAAPDRLYVSDASAIDPNALESNLAPRVQGAAINIGTGIQTIVLDRMILEEDTPMPAYDNDGDGTNDTDFAVGNGIIIGDLANPGRGTVCGTIGQIAGNSITLVVQTPSLNVVPVGGPAVDLAAIPAHVFWIDNNSELRRNNMIVANNVEDMQFALFFDDDGDNVIDAGEFRGDGVGANYNAAALDHSTLRQVRINFVMRTARPEETNTTAQFQAFENRAAINGSDGFRRRSYTSTVLLRNIGGRTII